MKLIATTAALALGSLLMLAPGTSHADSWQISLNLTPQPMLAYAQPTVTYYAPQPAPVRVVQIIRPRPVVVTHPLAYYNPHPYWWREARYDQHRWHNNNRHWNHHNH